MKWRGEGEGLTTQPQRSLALLGSQARVQGLLRGFLGSLSHTRRAHRAEARWERGALASSRLRPGLGPWLRGGLALQRLGHELPATQLFCPIGHTEKSVPKARKGEYRLPPSSRSRGWKPKGGSPGLQAQPPTTTPPTQPAAAAPVPPSLHSHHPWSITCQTRPSSHHHLTNSYSLAKAQAKGPFLPEDFLKGQENVPQALPS